MLYTAAGDLPVPRLIHVMDREGDAYEVMMTILDARGEGELTTSTPKSCESRDAFARKSNDPADFPNPDLAIEIDLSRPKVDRPSIYAVLGVVEVWQFDGETLVIEHLQADGSYASVESSQFLPIRAEDVRRWLVVEDSTHRLAWERRLGEWARIRWPGVIRTGHGARSTGRRTRHVPAWRSPVRPRRGAAADRP